MSEPVPSQRQPSAETPQRPRRKRRWRRAVIWLLVLAVIARLLLGLLLPWIVSLALDGTGLQADWRRMDLSLSCIYLRFEGLTVQPQGAPVGNDPMLLVDDIELDVDVLALLTGSIELRAARISGVRIHLERTLDDRVLLRGLPTGEEPAPNAPDDATAAPAAATEPDAVSSRQPASTSCTASTLQPATISTPSSIARVSRLSITVCQPPSTYITGMSSASRS